MSAFKAEGFYRTES